MPLDLLAPMVYLGPSHDMVEHDLYLDMVDEIASTFGVPSAVIESRIRELSALGQICA